MRSDDAISIPIGELTEHSLTPAVMATTSNTNPDTLVTLKVNIEGSNRRFKLPLRELGANTLPDKVRHALDGRQGSIVLIALFTISVTSDTVNTSHTDVALSL